MITQTELLEYFHYAPATGVFTRLKTVSSNARKGDTAGSLDAQGYWIIKFRRVQYKAHRLAWLYVYGSLPEPMLDHKNGIRNDNRLDNIRLATPAQNAANRSSVSQCSSSRCVGVSWHKTKNKWVAYICRGYKQHTVGHFSTKEAAVSARREAELFYAVW